MGKVIINKSIKKTAAGFEESFSENAYYNSQTQDSSHLTFILQQLNIEHRKRILDLGTGSGYLAFALAQHNPQCHIIGIDIVENTISRNNLLAKEKYFQNLEFISYGGEVFPFRNNCFDTIVSRYALHHFSNIDLCFRELSRVLKTKGQLFISDPTPNKMDKERFIDKYMQMKDDGHICFYSQDELMHKAKQFGFIMNNAIVTKIRFPRKEAFKYSEILNTTGPEILNAYQIEIIKEEIFITEDVLNLSFTKNDIYSRIK